MHGAQLRLTAVQGTALVASFSRQPNTQAATVWLPLPEASRTILTCVPMIRVTCRLQVILVVRVRMLILAYLSRSSTF